METPTSAGRVPFTKLISLFQQRSEQLFILSPPAGEGNAQFFQLEQGLQAQFWNFCHYDAIEIDNSCGDENEAVYFTLTFFLNTKGILFSCGDKSFRENMILDTTYTSNASHCKITLAPMARAYWLSIRFSCQWLQHAIKSNDQLENITTRLKASGSFPIYQSMSKEEKAHIQELMEMTWKVKLGTFFVKSRVLTSLSNFFDSLSEMSIWPGKPTASKLSSEKIDQYVSKTLTQRLPCLSTLSTFFAVSKSTLKRYFKKEFGVSISTYFLSKKMEYARRLMKERSLNISQVAALFGYKNLQNFKYTLGKYSA